MEMIQKHKKIGGIMANDKLTNLLFYDDFKDEIAKVIADCGKRYMLISGNISNFKYINNIYGYEKGDKLLKAVADFFILEEKRSVAGCRVHSDRFLALIDMGTQSQEAVHTYLEQRIDTFKEKIIQDFPLVNIHLNCGAYILDEDSDGVSEIVDKAEMARKSAKDNYLVSLVFYDKKIEEKAKLEREIIPMFERALKDNRILVYLQPKLAIETGMVVGAEALVRMQDDEGNIVPPGVFVPTLERTGMIMQLDFCVLEQVCSLIRKWLDEGIEPVRISVNLSRFDFQEDGAWEQMLQKIEEYHIPREYLEFEVTETIFYDDVEFIVNKLRLLRAKGHKVSMDDFGSGYSSLNTVGLMPIDIVKFDRGFVQNSINTHKGLQIMTGLVDIFNKINLEVICEGVETVEEEKTVQKCGCDYVQGYVHDKPLPIDVFEAKYMKKKLDSQCEKR